MRKKIIIIGTGGLAREFTDFFEDQIDIIGYSSKSKEEYHDFCLSGEIFDENITPKLVGTDLAVIAVGVPELKYKIYNDLSKKGFIFPSFIHKTSYVSSTSQISCYSGIIISPNCLISTDILIGQMTYLNVNCNIGHDTYIGGFCQLNGGFIGGNTVVGDYCHIGSGSTIIEKRKIGNNVLIGSGSVVMTNIDNNCCVMGNPAKVYNFKKPIE